MKRFVFVWVVLGVSAAVAAGCGESVKHAGSDDSGGSSGSSGKNGQSGRGDGGSSGKSGGAGPKAGMGGSSGRGSAGRAGGGSAGDGGGGNGGEAAMCSVNETPHKLADCPEVFTTDEPRDTVLTTCSFDATCEALGCGKPTSQFEANGCRRQQCASSEGCADGQRCVAPVLAGETDCGYSVYEGCEVGDSCRCSCIHSDDCANIAVCMPASVQPPSKDCALEGLDCDDISWLSSELEEWLGDAQWQGDLVEALEACEQKVTAALDACDGAGGAGAGGAGAGGQAP